MSEKSEDQKLPNLKPQSPKPQGAKIVGEKLQKVLARAGHGSRREIEAIIQQGRVSVDGKISTLGDRVEVTQATKIRLDGHLLSITESEEAVFWHITSRKVNFVPAMTLKVARRYLIVCLNCVVRVGLR